MVLQEEGRTTARSFHLVEDAEADLLRDRIAVSSPQGQRLAGVSVGDSVPVQEGIGQITATVIELKSSYVHAYQETLDRFAEWFPQSRAIRRFDVSADHSTVLELVDAQHEQMVALKQLYQSRRIAVETLANLAGRSLVETWLGLAGTPGELMIAAVGTAEEFERADKASAQSTVVVDTTALLTVVMLRLEDVLVDAFDRIYIAQHVFDEINAWHSNRRLIGNPQGVIGKNAEGYYMIDHDQLDPGIELMGRARILVERCQKAPANARLEIAQERVEVMHEAFGATSIASALVAKELELPLLTDDLGLRLLAESELGVRSTWTQALLRHLRMAGRFDEADYRDVARKLAGWGYRFVEINATDLIWILEQADWNSTPVVTTALGTLGTGSCSETAAIGVAAEVLKDVWVRRLLPNKQAEVLQLCLRVLLAGRSRMRVVECLKNSLKARMRLVPLAKDDLLRCVDAASRSLIPIA